jgi:methylase of polypeptide subunit release factors
VGRSSSANPQKGDRLRISAVARDRGNGKAVATDYYSQPIKFSYWNSCSNGGRQGLLEAQRFHDDFDGIVANAPWVDQTGSRSARSGIRRR